MYLHALSTAVPERSFTQAQCWEFIERSHSRLRLTRRSRLILHSILRNDHGIAKRHFAVPDIENVFDLTPDQLNAAFRHAAPELAGRALKTALPNSPGEPSRRLLTRPELWPPNWTRC